MSDSKAAVNAEILDGVGVLTIRDPKRHNALDPQMWRQLSAAIERFGNDPSMRAVVLTGGGYHDFATGTPDWEWALPAFEALTACPLAVIARIRGDCLGSGLALALAADIRVAAADCAFAFPLERDPQPVPQAVLGRLVALVGPGQAARLLLTGARIESDEALRIGLVESVIGDTDLADSIAEIANTLSETPAGFAAAAKRGIARAISAASPAA